MTESQIVTSICEYLDSKQYFFFRANNTPIFDTARKTFRAMPKYAKKGVPDIIMILGGQFIGLEVKMPGNYLSPDQKKFQEELAIKGSCDKYYMVRSTNDVIKLGF